MPPEEQSPINLAPTIGAEAPTGYLSPSWNTSVDGFLVGGDHGIEVQFPITPNSYLDLAGKRYHLRQFHFHHPSEHLLEAQMFDGELHLVHQNLHDLTIAVVGVFLTVDHAADDTKTKLMEESFMRARTTRTHIPLTPEEWLPAKRDQVLRYEGSLTTPPFAEMVSWIVFREPKVISTSLFQAIFGSHPQSARGIQAVGRRYVLDLKVAF